MNLPLDGEITSHISSLFHTCLRSVYSHVSPWDGSFYCSHPAFAAERAVRETARTSANTEDGFSLNREQDGTMGGGYRTLRYRWVSILSEAQRLQQTGEVAVTLCGVCLCAFWTALLYQLLWATETPSDPAATAEAPRVPNCESSSRSHHTFVFQKHQELFWGFIVGTEALMWIWVCCFLRPEIIFML